MRIFWALLALVTPVIIIYTQFLGNPLVFDDVTFFHGDEFGLYLHKIFSFNLRWLPYATFVWTKQILGDAIIWLRLGNLLFHLITSATLFFFLSRLFEVVIPNNIHDKTLSPFWLAFFGALIFALHPVSVYAAGYLVQRSTLMATLFTLLTWRLFLEGLITERRIWLYISAFTYLLAALSKEHAITAPAVTLALLWLLSPQPQSRIKLVWSTYALYVLIALFIVFQLKTKNILGQAYEPFSSALVSGIDTRFSYPLSVLTQTFVFFKYLRVWLIPSPAFMSVDICQTFAMQFWSFPEVLGLIGFISYGFLSFRLLRQRGLKGLLGFALICPWLLFFTELATVRLQEVFVLYRSYLWMAGGFAALPFLCQKLTAKQAAITLICVALLLMPLTWLRLSSFSHLLLLWDDAKQRIKNDSDCPIMYRILNNHGKALMDLERYPEAIEDFSRAINEIKLQQKPMISANSYNRGFAYLKMKQYSLALDDFNTIVEPIPTAWMALYLHKGQAFEGLHELTTAQQFYEKACVNGIKEGCDKQKELEKTIK